MICPKCLCFMRRLWTIEAYVCHFCDYAEWDEE